MSSEPIDVSAKIQECRVAIETSKSAAQFVDDFQEYLGTDDTFVRALVERVEVHSQPRLKPLNSLTTLWTARCP